MKILRVFFVMILTLTAQGAFAGFSAVAYNPTTQAWGEGHGYNSADEATNAAIAYCGGGCTWVAWAENGCVALANNPSTGVYGYSWGYDTSEDAVNGALAACDQQLNSGSCEWRAWACD